MIKVQSKETWGDLPRPVTAKRLGPHTGKTIALIPGVHEVGPAGNFQYEVRVKPGQESATDVQLEPREIVLIRELTENELLPLRKNQ